MADIAVPFLDETDTTDAYDYGALPPLPVPSSDLITPAVPIDLSGPVQPLLPKDLPEAQRQSSLRRSRLELEAATNEVERLKPTLGKVLLATGLNLREGAAGTTKRVVGNLLRLQTELTAPKEDPPVGSTNWFVRQALTFSTGQQIPQIIHSFQDQSDPESLANIMRLAGTDLAAEGTEQLRKAAETTESLGGGTPTTVAGFLASTAGASAPALLAGPLGIAPASVAAGVTSFGSTVDDFKEKLMSLDPKLSEEQAWKKALLPAGIAGTVTGLLTRGFGGIEKLTATVAQRGLSQTGVKQMISETLRSASLEMPEEFLDQLSQGIIEKAMVDPNKQWNDIISDAAIAGLTALPTSLGTAAAITGTAQAVAGGVNTAAQAQERSRLRRVVAQADRLRTALRIQMEEENAKGKVQTTGGLPAQQGQSTLVSPAKQTETGAAQRGGPGQAQPGATPVTPTSTVVTDAAKQSAPPPTPAQPRVAVFGGYQFNNPGMPTYQIPGVRGLMRNVSADTARQLGYTVPENIPTFEQWDAQGRPVPQVSPQAPTQELQSPAQRGPNETLSEFLARRRAAGEFPTTQPYAQSILELEGILSGLQAEYAKKPTAQLKFQITKAQQQIEYQKANPRELQSGASLQTTAARSPNTIPALFPGHIPGKIVQQIAKTWVDDNPAIFTKADNYPGGWTKFMHDLGSMATTPEDVAALRTMAEQNGVRIKAAMAAGDFTLAMTLAGTQPSEAFEFATGVKLDGTPKWDTMEKLIPGYTPPVPDAQYTAAKGRDQQASQFDWKDYVTQDEAGYQVLNEQKLVDALKSGAVKGNPALDALLVHLLQRSDLHPLKGIRLYEVTPNQAAELFGTTPFHGRFTTRSSEGNVATIDLAMLLQNGSPITQLGFLITLTHELLHNNITSKLSSAPLQLITEMNALFGFAKNRSEGTVWQGHNAMSNLHEFFAEGLSNPDFQKWLTGLDYQTDAKNLSPSRNTVLGKFLELVKKLFNLPDKVTTFNGQTIEAITALDQMVSLGQQLEGIQREGGRLEASLPASTPPPLPSDPNLDATKVQAGASSVGRIAEKVVADREKADAALENLAYERRQYREANAKLKELTDIAVGRFTQQDIDPEEVEWPDATAGIIVDDDGFVSVDGTFTDALELVGVPHNAANVQDLQARVFIERSAKRYNNLQKQIKQLENAVALFKQIKAKKPEITKVNKQIKTLKQEAAKLGNIRFDISVEARAAEMTAAEAMRTERIAKSKALGLAPVQDFFGRQVGGWRMVEQKITAGINYLNTLIDPNSTPEEQLAAQQRVAEWVNLPGDVMTAIKGGRELTDEQKSAVFSALGQIFEEYDLRSMEMKELADARLPELARDIREQLTKISDAKIDSGMAEILMADVMATLDGETGKSGTLTSQRRQLQLRKDVAAIKSFAMAVSNDFDANGQLFNWLINPTTMRPILPPGTTVGVGPATFNMILDEVKSNPEFGSAILTLINASNEKLAQIPVVGLKKIEALVKKGTEAALLEAKVIADDMLKDAQAKASLADADLRQLLRGLRDMEIEQRTLQEGMAMFAELGGDPDFRAVREHVGNNPYGLVEPMVPSNHKETTFKAFGTPNLPSHPELKLEANADPHFKSQWFQKVWQWYQKATDYVDGYDAAQDMFARGLGPSPASLGYDLPKVRGLRDAIERAVPGAFLELSLNTENKRWKVPGVARHLAKYSLFRQHDLIAKMVGGVTGTDLRSKLGDFINHYLIGQSIRDRFRDLPDKLHVALQSHPEFNMNVQLYREHWNEMAHWGRMFGSPLAVGFRLPRSGRKVTAADMALLQRNRAYSEQLRRRVTESNPTQGIRVKTPTRTLVRPGASVGDEGMPRFRNRRADNFIAQIIAAYGEPAGTFSYTSPLGINSTDPIVQFWNQNTDLLVQHVLDVSRMDRTMRQDPKMKQAQTALMNQWIQTGTAPTLSSIEDLVTQLLPHFNPTPGLNAQEQLVGMLADELKQYRDAAKGIENDRNVQDAARSSQPEIAFSADNEFTRPAAQLELPTPLYDYGALSSSEHLVLSSRSNHERIVAYANALNRAVAEMRSRMAELGKSQTPQQVAEHYGGNVREMSEVLTLLGKVQDDFKNAYDSGSFLRAPRGKINDTLGLLTSAVLALPTVGIRNMTAGQFEVYMMSRAMGNAGHWMALYNVSKNLTKTLVRMAFQVGEGIVQQSNIGAAYITGKNRHIFEASIRSFADAITGGEYGKNGAKVANLGMDSRESFRQRLRRIWQETSEFSNMEDALSTWTVKGRRVASTAAVPVKLARALFDKIGVQQYDFALNSTALTYAESLARRMKEVALAYGEARDGLGPFDPTNRAFDLKPHEWGKFISDKENEDSLAFFRLFAEQAMGPEGFQLERSMWNWYQAQKTNPQAPLLTDRQMDALQRKLLADFNASTPANRPSSIAGNPTIRHLFLLQGYVSDGVLKILNSTLGSVRDRAGFAKAMMKAPIIAMLALASLVIGLMQGVAGGAWEKYIRGRMTSLPTPLDKDFYTNIKRFAEGSIGLAASNLMYIGDIILWLAGEVRGNRGFDPHMRVFGLSVLQRAINSIRGTWATALGSQNFGLKSLVPISDAIKSMTPFWLEVENAIGHGAGELKQGERVERGEYASQGLLPVKGGFTPPQYGPTTVSRRLLGDYVSQWARYRQSDPAASLSALDKAKAEIQKLEEYHYRQYLAKGYTDQESREKARRDTWNDYQEINPAVAALLGRRPTEAQHSAMLAGLTGDRLNAAKTAEAYWKAGAMALFNREGYITREEGENLRAGSGFRQWSIPGLPRIEIPGANINPFSQRQRVRREVSSPQRRVGARVARFVNRPLRRVKAGRRAVRKFITTRERKRKKAPSLARSKQRSVVRRVQFAPYSFA